MITLRVSEFTSYCASHGISHFYYTSESQKGDSPLSYFIEFQSADCHVNPSYIRFYNGEWEFIAFYQVDKILVKEPDYNTVDYTCKIICNAEDGNTVSYTVRMD